MKRTILVLSIGALTAVASASAHHSFAAAYFEDQRITVEGDVTSFELVNPHAWVHISAADESGRPRNFSAEWSNPARLKQAGLTAQSIRPGDHVIITGSPGRNPSEGKIHLRTIERPSDGWKWPIARAGR